MTRDEASILKRSLLDASYAINENNDCAVRAVAAVTGLGYDNAHAALANAGRKNRKGTSIAKTRKAVAALGFTMDSVTARAKTTNTIERERGLQSGSYLIRVARHILPMVDGQIIDHTQGRNFRVREVYRVEPIAGFAAPINAPIPFKPMAQHSTQQSLFTTIED